MIRTMTRRRSPLGPRSRGRSLVIAASFLASAVCGGAYAAGGEEYRVAPGDLLRIAIYNDARLSGDFRVAPQGTISYPLIGEIPVAEMTPGEIGRQLAARLDGQIPINGMPAVQIAEYAPVYVVGDVVRAGPYPFRPDMIALELVSLAGGLRLAPEVESRVVQLIAAERQLADAQLVRSSLIVRRARLTAEIEGKPFDGSDLAGHLFGADADTLIANEVDLFNVRRNVFAAERQILEDQWRSYDQEISSLEQSIALHDEEVALLQQEVDTAASLVSRGLSTQSKLLELRRQLSATKRDALELRSFLARARQAQLGIRQKQIELGAIRDRENAEALREVDLSLSHATQAVNSAAMTLDQLRIEMNRPQGLQARSPRLTVIRAVDGRRQSIPIDDLAAIRPGDILRVDAGIPASGGGLTLDGGAGPS